MCSIPIAALAISVIGVGVSVYGQIQAGKARKEQAYQEAEVARKNAVIAKQNAKEAREAGHREEARQRLKTSQLIGKQRAAIGANGVLVDSGSSLDVQLDTAMMGELDALTIRRNAERKAVNYERQSEGLYDQAGYSEKAGDRAETAGWIGGAGTLLSGGASVMSNYYSSTRVTNLRTT